MCRVRILLTKYPGALALVCLLAMLMKLLVPAGYMVAPSSNMLTVQICNGTSGTETMEIEIPMKPGSGNNHSSPSDHQSKVCPFGSSSHSALNTVDPVQLALALAFVLLLATHLHAPAVRSVKVRLRPPLRGPPLSI